LAWAPPLLRAQAGLQPVRSIQALSQRQDLPAHWQGAEAFRKYLKLRVAVSGGDVEWFVNGARVAPQNDGRFFWQLAAGEWNLRAVSREKFAEQRIVVESMSN
jgi:membrane carboxypeptidase/penicillin-binding protein PbpC